MLTTKGEGAKLFLDECVEEDQEKCRALLEREFVCCWQRSELVKKLITSGSRKLQQAADADLALRTIQTMAKYYLSCDRVTVWIVDSSSQQLWTAERPEGRIPSKRVPF